MGFDQEQRILFGRRTTGKNEQSGDGSNSIASWWSTREETLLLWLQQGTFGLEQTISAYVASDDALLHRQQEKANWRIIY
eukprot:scaffold2818_cov59-Cylindrotheca_fusiformis.AAC.1